MGNYLAGSCQNKLRAYCPEGQQILLLYTDSNIAIFVPNSENTYPNDLVYLWRNCFFVSIESFYDEFEKLWKILFFKEITSHGTSFIILRRFYKTGDLRIRSVLICCTVTVVNLSCWNLTTLSTAWAGGSYNKKAARNMHLTRFNIIIFILLICFFLIVSITWKKFLTLIDRKEVATQFCLPVARYTYLSCD